MHCAGCAAAVENVLKKSSGVHDVDVSFAAEQGRLRYDPTRTDPDTVFQALKGTGYRARILSFEDRSKADKRQENTLLQLLGSVAFGMQVMLLYLVVLYPRYSANAFDSEEVRRVQYMVWALASPVVFFGGSSFLIGAWRGLRARTANMDTLVALGTLSAYGYSVYVTLTGRGEVYFDSVVMITTFIMLGRYLEATGGARARKDIRQLLDMQPERARRRSGEGWEEVPAGRLKPEQQIMIRPGERVPADAQVVEGEAHADESLVTGESAPVAKKPGSTVLAGTVVTDGALICRVTREVGDTRLAQITRLVQRTLSQKPPIQRLADRAAAWFALGILAAAVLTVAGWYLAAGSLSRAMLTGVAVLVVACPCALGLATPLALVVSLGRATRAGLLVRNPLALENAAKVRILVLDKTGTLTEGRMSVARVVSRQQGAASRQRLLRLAAAVEQFSEHPAAKAIMGAVEGPLPEAGDFTLQRGQGAGALVGAPGRAVRVGSRRFAGEEIPRELRDSAARREELAESVVWVSEDSQVLGFITLRDRPNQSAREALRLLGERGLHTVMLSGDQQRTVEAVARELGLEDYEGECPPESKADRIRGWQKEGKRIAMVGDGVNDAPALAQADLSITVAGGTDVAGETSDVILTRPDLTLLPRLVDIARKTRRIILENLGWAFAYNLIALPLAAVGLIRPIIAAVAMACSSLLVVSNSLRLKR
jgi:heavy metal translocating P-type ATPase